MRAHGLQWPPHPHQAAALLLGLSLGAGYFSITVPLIDSGSLRVAAAALYATLAATTAVLYVVVTLSDPSDPGLPHKQRGNKSEIEPDSAEHEHCHRCQARVLVSSKHCRRCDRCTKHFDHHCVWLNNCIGGANYRSFMALLVAALALAGLQAAMSALQLAASFHAAQHAHWPGGEVMLYGSAVTALRVGWAVLAGASGAAGAAVGELLLFHVRLRCLGLSTYEFVLRQRARRGLPEGSSFEHSPETHATSNGVPRVALARPAHQRPPFWHAFKAGAEAHADPVLGQRDGHLDPAGAAALRLLGRRCERMLGSCNARHWCRRVAPAPLPGPAALSENTTALLECAAGPPAEEEVPAAALLPVAWPSPQKPGFSAGQELIAGRGPAAVLDSPRRAVQPNERVSLELEPRQEPATPRPRSAAHIAGRALRLPLLSRSDPNIQLAGLLP